MMCEAEYSKLSPQVSGFKFKTNLSTKKYTTKAAALAACAAKSSTCSGECVELVIMYRSSFTVFIEDFPNLNLFFLFKNPNLLMSHFLLSQLEISHFSVIFDLLFLPLPPQPTRCFLHRL